MNIATYNISLVLTVESLMYIFLKFVFAHECISVKVVDPINGINGESVLQSRDFVYIMNHAALPKQGTLRSTTVRNTDARVQFNTTLTS